MSGLLKIKEVIKSFYEKYDRYLKGVMRFAFALCMYLTVMYHAGYSQVITSPYIAAVMALVSAFLPVASVPVFAGILLVVELYAVSLETALVAAVFFLIMMLSYFVFRAGNSWLMSFTMLLMLWNLPAAILPAALLVSPSEIIVVVFGIVTYGLMIVVKKDVSMLTSGNSSLTMAGRVNLLLTDLFTSNRFLLLLLSVTAVMLFICIMRKSRINYAPLISVVVGGFVFAVLYFAGCISLSIGMNYGFFALGLLLFALFSAFVLLFILGMDYRRVEMVQFEDDDYFYFVKAVPKRSITKTEKRVENITESKEDENPEIDMNDLFVHKDPDERKEEK